MSRSSRNPRPSARRNPFEGRRGEFGIYQQVPLMEGVNLIKGLFETAEKLINHHSDAYESEDQALVDAALVMKYGFSMVNPPRNMSDEQLDAAIEDARSYFYQAVISSIEAVFRPNFG